ncbi:hypothetical protein [Helicobacter burdigaliensis]|uniref:hypothetical protein n=1 Tax=Helicobacter burdigaliensis TaxID=2315334 RepID=UPI000EF67387|nr:hypothetical protein [Helicobacter burdigaliensis]
MAFSEKCEVCGQEIDKSETLSVFQSFVEGGIIECKNCKTRYKSKYKTSFFDGLLPMNAAMVIGIIVVKILLEFVFGANFATSSFIGFLCVVMVAYRVFASYFMPLRKISKKDEGFFDIKDEF